MLDVVSCKKPDEEIVSEYKEKKLKDYHKKWYETHKEEQKISHTKWYATHKEKWSGYSKKSDTLLKNKFLEMYGNECNCPGCNEKERNKLTLDHVQNNASKQKEYNHHNSSRRNYRVAIKEYRPDLYQILCFNCNCGKYRNKGTCPHINIIDIVTTNKARFAEKKYRDKVRAKFVSMYGGKCSTCGESNRWFLTLDHINNNGFEKRKNNTICNKKEYLIAINNYNPNEFQVLCYNCNCSKNTTEVMK